MTAVALLPVLGFGVCQPAIVRTLRRCSNAFLSLDVHPPDPQGYPLPALVRGRVRFIPGVLDMVDASSRLHDAARPAATSLSFTQRWLRAGGWALSSCLMILGAHTAVAEEPATAPPKLSDDVVQAEKMMAEQMVSLQQYIVDTYRVPLQSVQTMVESAWAVGESMGLDPLLLLAVMAIESSFNVKAESHMGAQGLMQVMTRIHRKRFEPHGGVQAVFQPEANIAVGAQILQECIDRRGSLLGGLTCYVGAAGTRSAYGNKVLAKRDKLRKVALEAGEELILLASTEASQSDLHDEDHVIEAPPISRFVEADAPRLARALLNERGAVDL